VIKVVMQELHDMDQAQQSGRGLPQSKTLARIMERRRFPPGFGLRQPSAAFGARRTTNLYSLLITRGKGLLALPFAVPPSGGFPTA